MDITGVVNLSIQISASMISAIIVLCVIVPNRMKRRTDLLFVQMLVCNMSYILMNTVEIILRGKAGTSAFFWVRAVSCASEIFRALVAFLFVVFEVAYLERKKKQRMERRAIAVCRGLFLLQSMGAVGNIFYPFLDQINAQNVYHRLAGYSVKYIFYVVILYHAVKILWKYRSDLEKWEKTSFFVYLIVPFLMMLLSVYARGIEYIPIGSTVALVIMYIFLQAESARREAERQNELTKSRLAMSLSQIQPHFLFNALNSIEYLCMIQSPDAADTVNHFARYLRGNMDSLSNADVISLKEEITHLENYFYIEKIRFPHIKIIYDLQCEQLMLPPLTIQPLVENAIKHGLRDQKQDAHVIIRTREETDAYRIMIEDNGTGFDPHKNLSDQESSHIGIQNIRTRLYLVVKGKLEIQSTAGKGTVAEITIPKQKL